MTRRKNGRMPVRFTGQHFMQDHSVITQIINRARITKNDMVLDIGAGKGNLTGPLSRQAGRVIAIEPDTRLAAGLEQSFESHSNVKILCMDFREIPLPGQQFKVVSNIPYSITTEILGLLMDKPLTPFQYGIIIMEWGAAKRFVSTEQTDPRIITWNTWFDLNIIRRVSRKAFSPPPKVTSALVELHRKTCPEVSAGHFYRYTSFVASMLRHLEMCAADALQSLFTRNQVKRITADAGIDAHAPVKALRISQWCHCFNTMLELVPKRIQPAMPGKYRKLYRR